jgi:hypothetical protein
MGAIRSLPVSDRVAGSPTWEVGNRDVESGFIQHVGIGKGLVSIANQPL